MTPDAPRSGPDPLAVLIAPSVRRRLLLDLGPLRHHRDFRLLWLGQSVTFLGSMITYVAVPYQVYTLTRSSLLVGVLGMLGLVEFVAVLSTAFLGGALADAVDRRRMVRLTEAGLLIGSLLLVGNSLLRHPSVMALFVVVGLITALDALQRMRAVPPPPDAERPSLRGVLEGLRYARSRPELMGTYLVDINATRCRYAGSCSAAC